jgi:sugar phosphate permease
MTPGKQSAPHVREDTEINTSRSILVLIWLMMMVAYIDRVILPLAGPSMSASLGLTKTQFGLVLSAFSLGYAAMQIPGGFLADRFGARRLLILALLAWSLFTGLTGLAVSFSILVLVRVLFGLGEGLENGAQFKLIGDHFHSTERSAATGVFLSALAVGPALATPVATHLLQRVGWQGMFLWFTVPGLIVAGLLYAYLPRGGGSTVSVEGGNVGLRRPETWIALAAYLLFNIAFWGFIGWIPTYLSEQRHISLAGLGWFGSAPYVLGFFGLILLGRLGSRKLGSRRALLVGLCYFAAGLFLFVALKAGNAVGCVAGLSCAAFFLYGAFGPFWGLAIDFAPAGSRGAYTGFINFGGQIGGILGPITIGRLADQQHSFNGAIGFMIGSLLLASATMLGLQMRAAQSR